MSSTNQSPASQPREAKLFKVGDICPQCSLKMANCTHKLSVRSKPDLLMCHICMWNTRVYEKSDVALPVLSPNVNICANVNCSNYDSEAERLMQWCCKACEPAAVDDLPQQVHPKCSLCDKPARKGSYYCSKECWQKAEAANHSFPTLVPSGEVTVSNKAAYQAPNHPPQMDIGNGRTTKCPDYHLIPAIALQRIAERFELGEVRKGNKAWNAGSKYQDVLREKDFILARLSHVIDHANKMMNEVRNGILDTDDNAGAIGWAGCFLICVREEMKNASGKATVPEQLASSPTGDADKTFLGELNYLCSFLSYDSQSGPDSDNLRATAVKLRALLLGTATTDKPVPTAT